MVIFVCLSHDQSDQIWQDQQTYNSYTSSGVIFQYEFDGDAPVTPTQPALLGLLSYGDHMSN